MASEESRTGVVQLGEQETMRKSESLFTKALRRLRHDRLTMGAIFIIVFLAIVSISAPLVTNVLNVDPYKPDGYNAFRPLCNPFADETNPAYLSCQSGNYLGTDDLGRDHLARLLYGGQISLAIGFASAIITVVIGLVLGMATGYFGGIFDDFINWVITTLSSLPQLYLLIAIAAIFEPSPTALVFIFAVTGWTGDTRLIRGQTFSIRDLDYVMAARALGASPFRIIRAHVFPNLISILAVSLALSIGNIILAEAALSFLNIGVDPRVPTWGNMLTEAQTFFRNDAIHLAIFPGLLISITVLCLYIIGDGVRDAFDPTVND
jgi:peptide/nickel transport system permease protein